MRARDLVVRTAAWCGVFVLVVAALPVVAVAGFVARGVAVVLGGASLLGVLVLCGVSAGFRGRLLRSLGLTPASASLRLVGRRS